MGTFTSVSFWHTSALIGSGVVTALPLLAFGAAARRVPLSMLGLLQFIVPVMQFLFAWLVFEEPMPASRWFGFAIVWVALVVFVTDMLRNARAGAPAAGRARAEPHGAAEPAAPPEQSATDQPKP